MNTNECEFGFLRDFNCCYMHANTLLIEYTQQTFKYMSKRNQIIVEKN